LLVANRSEIAVRVMRAATELGLRTVAIYAGEDRFGMHRFKADEAYQVGEGKGPVGAYLDIDGIVALAKEKDVDAIHPGYGFLSENPRFANACEAAGITFIGPRAELLQLMGDKIAARALTKSLQIPTLPGTDDPISDRKEAVQIARDIGFPLIIKAAAGGGGRGMRVVLQESDLDRLLDEAQAEARNAFGDDSVFLEKYIPRAKHIEVQVLGDRHGNVVHLHERDCSVQRRHQKVIEIAPSVGLSTRVREELCDAAVRIAREIGYDNAGTVEFLLDIDRDEWFFIEMNPRIQVEHTVTEVITGVDLVRSQILVAQGHELHSEEVALPQQNDIPRIGYAVQCRITTEDPENGFTPDYGKLLAYRSPGGFGIRLDGGMGGAGFVVTPFYDSLLVKLTVSGQSFPMALDRVDRALREFRVRGVKTNIPFLENVIANETFRSGQATTTLIDTTPQLFEFEARQDRATRLLNFLSDVIVNGNPHAKGYRPGSVLPAMPVPAYEHPSTPPSGTRQLLQELGPQKFADWTQKQKRLLVTDTTFRDAHQSLLATRVRSYDMLAIADVVARRTPNLFSMEMWGGATFDTTMRFLARRPLGAAGRAARAHPKHLFSDAVSRLERCRLLQLSRQRGGRFRQTRGGSWNRHFSNLRFAQLCAEPQSRDGLRCRKPAPSAKPRFATPVTFSTRIAPSIRCSITLTCAKNSKRWAHTFWPSKTWPVVPSLRSAQAGQSAQAGNRHSDSLSHARYIRRERRQRFAGQRCRV
jgi:pyruvate carboxylase